MEAEGSGHCVLGFRGAGQGVLALAAGLISAGIGRAPDLPVPEVVFASVNSEPGHNESDPKIRGLLRSSLGNNRDGLPGGIGHVRPGSARPGEPVQVPRAVWFDAFVGNVDRTARAIRDRTPTPGSTFTVPF